MTLTFLQHSEWTGCTHTQMGMMDAIMSLDQLVDESDPDVDFPNSFHAFQTAEGIRQAHPDKGAMTGTENTHRGCNKHIDTSVKHLHSSSDWFQLVGLIHDVGKIMALWDEPQVTLFLFDPFRLLMIIFVILIIRNTSNILNVI